MSSVRLKINRKPERGRDGAKSTRGPVPSVGHLGKGELFGVDELVTQHLDIALVGGPSSR